MGSGRWKFHLNQLFTEVSKRTLASHIEIVEKQAHINDLSFAAGLAPALLQLLKVKKG